MKPNKCVGQSNLTMFTLINTIYINNKVFRMNTGNSEDWIIVFRSVMVRMTIQMTKRDITKTLVALVLKNDESTTAFQRTQNSAHYKLS